MFTIMTVLAYGSHPIPADAAPVDAGFQSSSEVISRINVYRTQNGLYAYSINQDLMRSAQAQSDYQASIESVTHTGAGGTNPRDRATSAGYGDGATIWVSEIIYGGTQASVDTAMSWWKGSSVHNNSMLSPQYLEVGAGVTSSGGSTYFTVVMGFISGATSGSTGDTTVSAGENSSASVPHNPVVVTEPGKDGSIVHEVQAGQTLWTIAAVYGIPLNQLLELNNLNRDTLLQPGQEIIIQPPRESEPIRTPTLDPDATSAETNPTPLTSSTPQAIMTDSPSNKTTPKSARSTITAPQEATTGSKGGLSTIGAVAVGMIALYAVIILVAASFRNVDKEEDRAP